MRALLGQLAVLATAICLAAPVPGVARSLDSPLYVNMIAQDFAPGPTFAFADQAEATGDPDAAIAAIEQLLVRYPDNLDAHARMARLYSTIGNEALADLHRDLAGLPPATQVWGRATLGFAHETNPGATPLDGTIQLFDAATNTFVGVASGPERSDQLATFSLDLNLAHGLSDTALLAAEVYLEGEFFSAIEQLNSVLMQATVGPWISAPAIAEGASLRPFATLGAGTLDSAPYYGAWGAGLALNLPVDATTALTLISDVTYSDYSGEISPSFDADTLDNLQIRAGGQYGGSAAGIGFAVYAYGGYAFAESDAESYASLRGGAIASTPFASAQEMLGIPVTFRVGTTVDLFGYQAANVDIDPTEQRRDLWLGGDASLIFGVADDLDVRLGVDYVRRFSNVEVFDSQNFRVFFEAGVDF